MAFQIKRKGPNAPASVTEDKYEDAIHVAHSLIREQIAKSRTTVTNLKTGETLNEAEIGEAVLSIGPRKKRSQAA